MRPFIDETFLSLSCFCMLVITISICNAADTINTAQFLRDGESLVSSDGSFRLGFFEAGSSKGRYLGIWYNQLSVMTVVWVANRNQPLTNSSGVLKLTNQGILVLLDYKGSIIWSTNSSIPARNHVAQLQDSGNLVVKEEKEGNQENFLWQSFDYPSNTFMPEMKIGKNRINGFNRYLTSWKSEDDPSPGNFTYLADPEGYPEFIVKEGSIERFRLGIWNGLHFSGKTHLRPNVIYSYEFVYNENEIYYSYHLKNKSLLTRVVLNSFGKMQRFMWIDSQQGWKVYHTTQSDDCDQYALCGSYGTCNINKSPLCSCLKGFEPKSKKDWDVMGWSGGCTRKTPLNCSTDGFQKYSGVKLPETRKTWSNRSTSLEECKNKCKKNCSCTGYANLDVREGGSGCLLWFGELIDIRELTEVEQELDIYIRLSAYELEVENKSDINKPMEIVKIITASFTGLILVLALVACIWKRKQCHKTSTRSPNDLQSDDLELPSFDFVTIATATSDFDDRNKLGEGGFGPVYKGVLKDSQEIAVKRLSKNSRQGPDEFKNEVRHISRLQHRNLVKVLGCCIQRNEQMLIYEFLPNKSLNNFIFDEAYGKRLDWPIRYNIICGIARGLLYLHQDSRLRIIHRDLKAENILLDQDMNPKISDFGLARSFGGYETQGNTSKVAGTLGYISPEYANDGLYSTKSDVFSFGVMVLEIISSKRNRKFYHPDHQLNLLGHAWVLYKHNRTLELVPEAARDACNISQVLRSIQIGLLCVQSSAEDRPSMSTVVLMLGGEGAQPQPKQPGFFADCDFGNKASSSSSTYKPYASNEMSITLLEAR